jgi:large subunit ribosomal protein L6
MSKILVKVLFIPKNIKIYLKEKEMLLSSEFGNIKFKIPNNLAMKKNESFISLKSLNREENFGTWYQQLKNIIQGLSRGYNSRLLLKGVGYKVFQKEQILEMKLGYSHLIEYPIEKDIKMEVYKNTIINLKAPLKDRLGSISAEMRSKRKPDSYKGKGILYKGEKLSLKIGKKA